VYSVTNIFDDVAASARQELDKPASLIASVSANIEIASRIQIHRNFISPAR
jgi:autophagy-related protein 11